MADTGFGRDSVVLTLEQQTLTATGGETTGNVASFAAGGEKYEVLGHIGAGGMGEALLLSDKDLRRQCDAARHLDVRAHQLPSLAADRSIRAECRAA